MFQISQAVLMLQVTEWDIFTLNTYCLSKLILNWMVCILFAKSGSPRSCHLLSGAQVFVFAVSSLRSSACILGELWWHPITLRLWVPG